MSNNDNWQSQTYKASHGFQSLMHTSLPVMDESFRLFVNVKRDFRSEAN